MVNGLLCILLPIVLYLVFAIKMLDKVRKMLSYWYLQYELITCLYVFEPWEKKLLSILFYAECYLIVVILIYFNILRNNSFIISVPGS